MTVLIVREGELRELVGHRDALAAVREAFVALSRGAVEQPDVLSLDLAERRGEVHAKGAFIHGAPFYTIKVSSGFYDNPRRGLPVSAGAMWVFDAETGAIRAMLLDNGYLTDLRTAAAGALAAELLARPDASTALIVGAGGQARYQLEALVRVRRLERVLVWARRPEAAARYAAEMSARIGLPVEASGRLEEAVAAADIVVTTTPAREPLIRASWVAPGTHVTAVGSDMPGKHELDPTLLARAVVIADRLEQCRTQGEIAMALDAGAIALEDVAAELGDVAVGTFAGRTSAEEITVVDLTGVGALDAAMGTLVANRAIGQGIGEALDA